MRIAVLGTGAVGRALGTRLVETGHEVRMGSRTAGNDTAVAWAAELGRAAGEGTFADAAAWGEVVVNATGGLVSIDALTSAGADNLAGKVLLDVSNPLDFSGGFPPTVVQTDGRSLGEQIQEAFPDARVVKTLNTMNADVMVHPRALAGSHSVFVAGDDGDAKARGPRPAGRLRLDAGRGRRRRRHRRRARPRALPAAVALAHGLASARRRSTSASSAPESAGHGQRSARSELTVARASKSRSR